MQYFMPRYWLALPFFLFLLWNTSGQAKDVFMEPDVFLSEAFDGAVPDPSFLWLKPEVKDAMREVLGRDPSGLRVRYWQEGSKTAWILEEIGKTQPITTGIVIADGAVERLQVLIYRESHGWEVRYPFFTDQFRGMTLEADLSLSEQVDGISGATLSVRALTKLVRLALRLDAMVQAEG